MAGVDIEVTIRQDVIVALDRLVAAGADLTVPMRDIAGHLADTTRERFETQENPLGIPWQPSRRAIDEGGRTLTLSGDLSNSIAEDWGEDYAAAGPEASGGAAIYAAIHNFGGTIVPKTKKALSFGGRVLAKVVMPKREYLGFNEENADYSVDVLAHHLAAAFDGTAVTP